MCPLSAQSQSFPHLTKLLGNLRSGLKQFGLSEIQDLLGDRRDRDFMKKATEKLRLLQDAITEIQKKCVHLTYSPDPGHIKFLLWKRIVTAIRATSTSEWDGENNGHLIVAQLQA